MANHSPHNQPCSSSQSSSLQSLKPPADKTPPFPLWTHTPGQAAGKPPAEQALTDGVTPITSMTARTDELTACFASTIGPRQSRGTAHQNQAC